MVAVGGGGGVGGVNSSTRHFTRAYMLCTYNSGGDSLLLPFFLPFLQVRKQIPLKLITMLDFGFSLFFLLCLIWISKMEKIDAGTVDEDIVTAADYTICLPTLPAGIDADEMNNAVQHVVVMDTITSS